MNFFFLQTPCQKPVTCARICVHVCGYIYVTVLIRRTKHSHFSICSTHHQSTSPTAHRSHPYDPLDTPPRHKPRNRDQNDTTDRMELAIANIRKSARQPKPTDEPSGPKTTPRADKDEPSGLDRNDLHSNDHPRNSSHPLHHSLLILQSTLLNPQHSFVSWYPFPTNQPCHPPNSNRHNEWSAVSGLLR